MVSVTAEDGATMVASVQALGLRRLGRARTPLASRLCLGRLVRVRVWSRGWGTKPCEAVAGGGGVRRTPLGALFL